MLPKMGLYVGLGQLALVSNVTESCRFKGLGVGVSIVVGVTPPYSGCMKEPETPFPLTWKHGNVSPSCLSQSPGAST